MKKIFVTIAAVTLAAGLAGPAAAQVQAGISAGPGGVQGFYVSVGSYFRVPEAEVLAVRDRYRVADEELPVVFFLAARAHVAPGVIVDLRLGGKGWFDIAVRYHLPPDVFFVAVPAGPIGPPYGNAYGHYRKYQERHVWGQVVLTNREVVDLVNLRFISEYQKVPPGTVMGMRGKGQPFVAIHDQVVKSKGKPASGTGGHQGKDKDKDKGKGKGQKTG